MPSDLQPGGVALRRAQRPEVRRAGRPDRRGHARRPDTVPRGPAGRLRAWPERPPAGHLHRARGQLLPAAAPARRQDGRREAGQSGQAGEERGADGEHRVSAGRLIGRGKKCVSDGGTQVQRGGRKGHGRQGRRREAELDRTGMHRDRREDRPK